MATGTVDFFNDTGGYGFIKTEDSDEDVFFHMEDVGGPDLEEGQ
jgi:CspA family cold shock protein